MTGATPTIESNEFTGNAIAIEVADLESAPAIKDNSFCGNGTDLDIPDGSILTLDGNTVCAVAPSAAP